MHYRRSTEMNSRYYGFSLMRTLTRGPYSVRYEGSLLYYAIAFRFNRKTFWHGEHSIKYNIYSCEKSYAKKLDSKAREII